MNQQRQLKRIFLCINAQLDNISSHKNTKPRIRLLARIKLAMAPYGQQNTTESHIYFRFCASVGLRQPRPLMVGFEYYNYIMCMYFSRYCRRIWGCIMLILYIFLRAVELKWARYRNNSLGIEVQVLSSSQNSKLQLNQQMYSKTIASLYFSLHCGPKYFALNCGSLTALDTGNMAFVTVVIVPMENGILLTTIAYNNKTNVLQLNGEHVVDAPSCQRPLQLSRQKVCPECG